MAMNGINIAYATTGMEAIYNKVAESTRTNPIEKCSDCCVQVFLRMGFMQSELDDYFTGPAFLAWYERSNFS